MIRVPLSVVLLVCCSAATAQELPGPEGRAELLGSVVARPHREALETTLRLEYYQAAAKTAAWWAGFSGDPSLRPLLRQIVDLYAPEESTVSAAALASLAMLGEPPSYFVDYAAAHLAGTTSSEYYTALDAAKALYVYSSPSVVEALRARVSVVNWEGRPGEIAGVGSGIAGLLSSVESYRPAGQSGSPVRDEVVGLVTGYLPSAYGSRLDFYEPDISRLGIATNYQAALRGSLFYGLGRLQRLGESYPDSVRIYLPAALEDTANRIAREGLSMEAVQMWAMKAALPHEPFPAPPADPSADVRPLLECVSDAPDGLTAYLGYDNRFGALVSVPYGPTNRLTVGGNESRRQPFAFGLPQSVEGQPGRTPLYPGFAVAIPFASGETVTWTLPGGSATATSGSPRCDGSAPPSPPAGLTCSGQPATVYVSSTGLVVGGPLDGTPYAGRLVGTNGADVIVGTNNADAIEALGGDDTLCGNAGDDALDGGPGTDTTDGGPGTDGCDAESASACEGPIPALADVRPVLECVAQTASGFTAYFGYENRSATAGRVAYGARNRITPAAFDQQQPDLFGLPGVVAGRPGRTPFYPGHAFTVAFQAGESIVWRLGSRTSTASASSARCPSP